MIHAVYDVNNSSILDLSLVVLLSSKLESLLLFPRFSRFVMILTGFF